MSTARKRISIYDYPEHLNPFSEYQPTVPETRKIIVDKFRKNGTWSSKISKKLNRSVSWIEKSWLAVDDSSRKTYENRICEDLCNNALYTKQSQTHNETRAISYSDIRNNVETSHHTHIPNDNLLEKSKSIENINKCDVRKRKKRPAPLPPSPISIPQTVKESSPEIDATLSDATCEIANKCQNDVYSDENEVNDVEITEHKKLVDEMPNIDDNLSQSALYEQTLTSRPVNEISLSDDVQNLQIESHNEKRLQSLKCSEPKITQIEDNDKKSDDISKDIQPDENANIPSIKNENHSDVVPAQNKNSSF